ncbi:MAG TPA: wax ester/triacylglycerol synthase family O-acyltransferase [Candidatus Dormibacteraeota bacterium]|nr:wax ester/triacylglycerol synthase family O-acyltransferase [Candidatus Dormibacteraeota bacterium]
MAVLSGEALSRADVAWLHAEAPTNHFVVTSLSLLDSPLDVERFKTMLSSRIELHPRLRQVVAETSIPFTPQRWIPARNFDLDAHVHRVALPAPRGDAQLAAFIGDLVGQPLDFSRPLWELFAVEGPGRAGAMVGRFHHSLGDGQAMVRMLLSLTDETADGWKRSLKHRSARTRHAVHDGRSSLARLLDEMPQVSRLARQAAAGAGALARMTLLDPDRRTPLRGDLTMLKAVAWTRPVPLGLVTTIARAAGATVNDVIVSVVAGGLGEYLRDAGVETAGMRIRAMVPVNMRPPSDTGMTGNRFSLVYVELPVGISGAWERLMRVKIEMDRIKGSQEPLVGWLLVQGLGLLPTQLERLASSFYADKASLVLTNVIGPRRPIFMAGTPVRQMTFWEPESGGLGIGISIYSYAGEITVGVVSDRNLVAEPGQITEAVMRALAALSKEAS